MFSLVSEAVAKIIPVAKLRWLTIVHLESDECGSMNEWLAAAPQAEIMWSDWNVRFWHKADMGECSRFGNFAAQNNAMSDFSSSLLRVKADETRTVLE